MSFRTRPIGLKTNKSTSNCNNNNGSKGTMRIGQSVCTALICSVLSFYAGLTLGTSTATISASANSKSPPCPTEEQIKQRIQTHVQRALERHAQEQQQHQQQSANVPAAASVEHLDTDRRFPSTISDFATGMARVNRDEFVQHFHLGVPLDASSDHNSEVLLLYQSQGAIPVDNAFLAQEAASAVTPPLYDSVHEATSHCDYLNLVFTDHNPSNRHQCWAIMGQYESFHVQKYMRVENGALDSNLPLRLVNRGYHASGRKSLQPPSLDKSKEYWNILQNYLANLDGVLEQLKPHAAAAAAGNNENTVIVMVCNLGQSELLLNNLCAAKSRGLDLSSILIFATDEATRDLVNGLGWNIHVFYDETTYGDMPEHAAKRYADKTFMRMMMAKVFCVHMTMVLGYNVIFQDADVIWFQNPLQYFAKQEQDGEFLYDAYFQDDGNHAL